MTDQEKLDVIYRLVIRLDKRTASLESWKFGVQLATIAVVTALTLATAIMR